MKKPLYHVTALWHADDIKTLRPRWSLKRCDDWLREHREKIKEMLVGHGWDVISFLLENEK